MLETIKTTINTLKMYVDKKIEKIPEQVQSDWNQNDESAVNYIDNKPFYSEIGLIEILPQTTFDNFSSDNDCYREYFDSPIILDIPFETDIEYTVIWDGVEYKDVLHPFNGGYCLGYDMFYTEADGDSSLPFGIYIDYRTRSEINMICTDSSNNSHTLLILGVGENIHKIDEKFLPNSIKIGMHGTGVHAEVFNIYSPEVEADRASGDYSHAEGEETIASGRSGHAEGYKTTASGEYSHAEGNYTTASGSTSHAEGYRATASGDYSHAEGIYTTASGDYSHAEGYNTTALGDYQHVQGQWMISDSKCIINHVDATPLICSNSTPVYYSSKVRINEATNDIELVNPIAGTALGIRKIPHIYWHEANATNSRIFYNVDGSYTILTNTSQFRMNTLDARIGIDESYQPIYAHIVGNGSSSARSNAHTLDWDGNAWFAGDVYVGSTYGVNRDEGSKKLASEEYVDAKFTNGFNALILLSPNGTRFNITVGDDGVLSATEITE